MGRWAALGIPVLSDRQRRVLQAIVEDYIGTAEPVGSRTISRRHVEASPATIRNDMADLEELGFLEQPHTSAGRVPSDEGYRYYVDHILRVGPVPQDQVRLVENALREKGREAEALIHTTVRVLSQTSSLISIVLGPQVAPASLVRVEVAHAGGGRALLVLFSDAGFVETKLVDVPESIDPAKLKNMTDLINDCLEGETWERLSRPGMLKDLRRRLSGYEAMLDDTLEFLRSSLEPVASQRVYICGLAQMLDLPEFRDIERTKALLGVLDKEQTVSELVLERLAQGVTVTIGRENKRREMVDCSLVSAPYLVGGRLLGGLAVLGPKRMDYALLLPLVHLVAEQLNEALERLA
jgi:heat-inducible transcriptional repressor